MHEYPTQFVIFGGTGDLAERKLFPALLDLFVRGRLPEKFHIISLARTEYSDEDYRAFVKKSIDAHEHAHTTEDVRAFCDTISYAAGSFDEDQSYHVLGEKLELYDTSLGQCTNKLFYLAVPPSLYDTIFTKLSDSEVATECGEGGGWSRILVEKPFGSDLKSAQALDAKLASLFREEQIFRIDHYLAKEAVQNILSFRFANTFFHGSWNKEYIESVSIHAYETVDVANRGAFYDGIGALRDVGGNHMLQLLALIAMQEPTSYDSASIRSARAEILEHMKPVDTTHIAEYVRRAQYEGYRDVSGVREGSHTETFFELQTYINTKEWEGVPFYLSSGKALKEAGVWVEVVFKPAPTTLFNVAEKQHQNIITLRVSPEQTISIQVVAKAPGLTYTLEHRDLSFTCNKGDEEIKNSYEKVLLDCIHGDQTLFTSTREVNASWKLVDAVLASWDDVPLQTYTPGSTGPTRRLLET